MIGVPVNCGSGLRSTAGGGAPLLDEVQALLGFQERQDRFVDRNRLDAVAENLLQAGGGGFARHVVPQRVQIRLVGEDFLAALGQDVVSHSLAAFGFFAFLAIIATRDTTSV